MLDVALRGQLKRYLGHCYEMLLNNRDFIGLDPDNAKKEAEAAFNEIIFSLDNESEYIDSNVKLDDLNLSDPDLSFFSPEQGIWIKTLFRRDAVPDILAVLPVANEEKRITDCLNSFLSEVQKTKLSVFLIVIINNSTDKSFELVKNRLRGFDIPNLSVQIAYVPATTMFSLPKCLNLGYEKYYSQWSPKEPDKVYFFALDSDAIILNESSQSIFDKQISEFARDSQLMAISGLAIDRRWGYTKFHDFTNLTCRPEIASQFKPRPYTQGGGGGFFTKLVHYPKDLLKENDLGGASIGIECHKFFSVDELRKIPFSKWIIRTNPNILTDHPTRTNIADWICTYINYKKVRNKAANIIGSEKFLIWEEKRKLSKQDQYENLYKMVNKHFSLRDLAGFLIIKKYFYDEYLLTGRVEKDDYIMMSPRIHKNIRN